MKSSSVNVLKQQVDKLEKEKEELAEDRHQLSVALFDLSEKLPYQCKSYIPLVDKMVKLNVVTRDKMYILVSPDGTDFHSGTIDYSSNICKKIKFTDYDPAVIDKWSGELEEGLYTNKDPNECFINATIPCRAFLVEGIDMIHYSDGTSVFKTIKVIKEIKDLDKLFGWNYSELTNLINPFEIDKTNVDKHDIKLLKNWILTTNSVITGLDARFTNDVWDAVFKSIFQPNFDAIQEPLYELIFNNIGMPLSHSICEQIQLSIKKPNIDSIFSSIWDLVAAYIGTMFPNTVEWWCIDYKEGKYPFQAGVDLWKRGLIPSCDGDIEDDNNIWRLHGGKNADLLWEGKQHTLIGKKR